MGYHRFIRFPGLAPFLALAGILLFLPAPALGQGAGGEPPSYTAEEIERFARVHLEVAEVRDDLHQDLARYPEAGRREEARERADARLAELYERFEITAQQYEQFIVRTSLDQDLREAFEEALKRLEEEEEDPDAPL